MGFESLAQNAHTIVVGLLITIAAFVLSMASQSKPKLQKHHD